MVAAPLRLDRRVWRSIIFGMQEPSNHNHDSWPEAPRLRPGPEHESIAIGPSRIHGLGAFAQKDLACGTRIVEYLGIRINKRESSRRCRENNEYIFYLNSRQDLDGNVPWNMARFINHSCAPNCDAELIDERIWIVARRDIALGEELTFNYGYDLQEYKEFPCRCGSPECVGFMVAEEFQDQIRRRH